MNTALKDLSVLPVPTWNWLHINTAGLPEEEAASRYTKDPVKNRPAGITIEGQVPAGAGWESTTLGETAAFVAQNQNHTLCLRIPAGIAVEEPILLDFVLDSDTPALVNRLHIEAGENSRAAIVVRYAGTGASKHFHCGHVTINAATGARVHYTAAQLLQKEDEHADAVQARVADSARVCLLLAELGSAKAVAGADIELNGKQASAHLDSLYAAGGDAGRDLNYRIRYIGEKTEGEIIARGALGGSARKVLKSTIDFLSGAAGAKGREEESVLVLSDKVGNVSTPLLLCGEDDVEGQHATNIGRPNKDKLYYLMSRGFTEKQARRLLVEAQLAPILQKVHGDALREEMLQAIREVVHSGE